MCTVSFLPTGQGFALAMNRDEKKSRVEGQKPRRRKAGFYVALHPAEPGGGTWIGVNQAGLALALINWHAQPLSENADVSRGVVVPHLLAAGSLARMARLIPSLPLARINPFRLIAASLSERKLEEWRWDGNCLNSSQKSWSPLHWFSSGHEEAQVADTRARAARRMAAGTISRLRRLHSSHQPERSAFSICMHRDDAETVSYTEIVANPAGAQMRYAAGALCKKRPGAPSFLSFRGPFA
jgi:Transport and Golgi organisation 2